MSFLSPPLYSLTKALLFPSNCRSGTVYFARLAGLAGKTIAGMDPGRKPASFILASRRKEGRQTVKGCAFGLIPGCHLLLPAWKKGIVGVWGLDKLLDFPVQLLFTHRLARRWPEPPAICFIYPLVQITMHTAFSFIISDDCINSLLRALVQLKLRPLGTDTLMIFCVFCTPFMVHAFGPWWALVFGGSKTMPWATEFYLTRIIIKTDNIYWTILYKITT